ncbi:MAG: YihY/virulence factor BrkB family protein [Gammaproteobacteria bacterium]
MTTPTSRSANEADGLDSRPGRQAGRHADSPAEIPATGWKEIAKRVFKSLGADHVSLIAGGVAFFAFLSIFPALSAMTALYGLVVSPDQVAAQVGQLASVLPAQAQDILNQRLVDLTSASDEKLGWGLVLSVLLSLWSANKGTAALVEGLNIVYNEEEKRNFIKLKFTTLAFTLSGFIGAICCVILIVGISAGIERLGLAGWLEFAIALIRWPVLALIFIAALAMAYRFAPSRNDPKFRWVSVGSVVSTVLWLVLSAGFAYYVGNFGSYDEVYGSVAAVVITLLWLYLTVITILLGAEINGEMEAQTNKDTTVGPAKPIGSRGAYYADHKPG